MLKRVHTRNKAESSTQISWHLKRSSFMLRTFLAPLLGSPLLTRWSTQSHQNACIIHSHQLVTGNVIALGKIGTLNLTQIDTLL